MSFFLFLDLFFVCGIYFFSGIEILDLIFFLVLVSFFWIHFLFLISNFFLRFIFFFRDWPSWATVLMKAQGLVYLCRSNNSFKTLVRNHEREYLHLKKKEHVKRGIKHLKKGVRDFLIFDFFLLIFFNKVYVVFLVPYPSMLKRFTYDKNLFFYLIYRK